MINQSEDIRDIAKALVAAQQKIGSAAKSGDNPFFKSTYADLMDVINAVKGPLNAEGIAFLQPVHYENGKPVVKTILLHTTGQYLCSSTPVYCKKLDDPQAFGSGVTYSKRYALQAFLGLPTADDDAESAMGNHTQEKPAEKGKPSQTALMVISKVCGRLVPPNGREIDPDRVAETIRKLNKGRYVTEEARIPAIVDFLMENIDQCLIAKETK